MQVELIELDTWENIKKHSPFFYTLKNQIRRRFNDKFEITWTFSDAYTIKTDEGNFDCSLDENKRLYMIPA